MGITVCFSMKTWKGSMFQLTYHLIHLSQAALDLDFLLFHIRLMLNPQICLG